MHLYSIYDDQPDQDTNDGLPYLGQIFLEDHIACAALFKLAQSKGCDIHPFEDVRLNSEQVRYLVAIFHDSVQRNTIKLSAWQRVLGILATALEAEKGIISFCN